VPAITIRSDGWWTPPAAALECVGGGSTPQSTPTRIKTTPRVGGAAPTGRYVVSDAKYTNQFTFNGGVTVRFLRS
jgi:hypothetical protein